MPPGTPYNAFVLPYPIRVDQFTELDTLTPKPLLHLLTHTHSDHVVGLSSKSFGYPVICSHDAKNMLLRHEVYGERALYDCGEEEGEGVRSEKVRMFGHLKVGSSASGTKGIGAGYRDLLVSLRAPLFTATLIATRTETNRVEYTHFCRTRQYRRSDCYPHRR